MYMYIGTYTKIINYNEITLVIDKYIVAIKCDCRCV